MMYLLFTVNLVTVLVAFYVLHRSVESLKSDKDAWHPLLTEAVETCRGQAKMLALLKEISAQFQSDSGLSMRDAVNRLDEAAKQQFAAGELLKVITRDDRLKAELDREQLQRLLIELYRLTIKVESTMATTARIELAAVEVADDLAAAHKRADEITIKEHGAAADAASRQTEKEKDND